MTAESVSQAAAGSQDRRRWFALAMIVAAQFMVVLDIAIVNVALPSIKTDLNFSQESLQWVITALLDLLRRRPPARRPPRRPARTAATVRGRARPVHGQLAPRRPRLVGGLADRLPLAPGSRRCAALARGALDPDHDLPRGPRAQPRARHLGCCLGQRRRRGRAARRRPDQRPELVVDLLHQRARGRARDRADAVPAPRKPRRPRVTATSTSPAPARSPAG